ncbi:PAS domain S-box protein [Ancylothrix sp. C2]|uniref:hybrid sensor histidine kinase/response regulator n=1 Tax=Ancylothrix sp. D3o TaxID=2953691 RepID=UPI0021BAA9B9|nr:PAS domain S-box protein [Ancylothrix sp. D3o]MCT7949647.1 PAS domain S-box protein [Ancylothrix sp. D3o]
MANLNSEKAQISSILAGEALALFNLSLDLLSVAGLDGYFKRVNPAFTHTLGFSVEELISRPFIEYVHPEDRASTLGELQKLNTGTPTLYFENRYLCQDGSYKWLSWTAVPIPETQLMYAVGRDISERKQLEAARETAKQELEQKVNERTAELQQAYARLAERETLYRTIVETANEGIWLLDTNACTTFTNPQMTEILGYSEDEMLGRSLYDFMDESLKAETEQKFARRLQGKRDSLSCQFRHKDGSTVWANVSANAVFDSQGKVIGALGMVTDITERREIEQALQESQTRTQIALNIARMFSFEWNPFTDVVRRTVDCAPLLGLPLSEAEQETGTTYIKRIHPSDQEQFLALLQSITPENDTYVTTYRLIRPDGSVVILEESARAFFEDRKLVRLIGITQDVTERENTAFALRQSERQLRVIPEAIPHQVWTTLPDGRIDYYNQRAYDYTGATPEQLQNYGWTEFIHPEDLPRLGAAWNQGLEIGKNYQIEARMRSRDGVYRWFLSQAVAVRDEQGQIIKWYGTNTDIHDRKQAEEALRESTAILNAINETTPTLIYVKDRQGRFLMANPTVLRLLGKTTEEVIGKTDLDVLINLKEAERITANDLLVMESDEVQVLEEVVQFLDRKGTYISIKSPYRDEQGNVIGLIGISTEITERKQAEESLRQSELNFRTLADCMPQIFWTARADGFLDYYNQRWYDYTGMTFEETQGWGWEAVLHPDDVEKCVHIWSEAVRTGTAYQIEYRFKRASDGQYRWHLGRAFPLRDENGKIIKWFGSGTDIHDQKQVIAERDQALEKERLAREQAEAANRSKDEFLAVLSHELRSPLNPILGWTKMLQSRSFNEAQAQKALATIERNAKLQVQLIDDLLDISRIISGKLILNQTPVFLVDIIKAALETVQLSAKDKSIEIELHLEAQSEPIFADANRVQQILCNLLSNAIKFTDKNGRIFVRLSKNNGYAQLEVSDTGKGISPDFVPHVFELFRQQDSSTTRQFGGLGLGLALTQQLVKAHGGHITAESLGEGKGATFTVWLPILAAAEPATPSAPDSQPSMTLQNVRILVVDDEPDSLDIMKTLLEMEGAVVTAVESAPAALEVITKSNFDLLISDIGMPGMDGYGLLAHIRQLPPEKRGLLVKADGMIKAISVSGYAGEWNQQKSLQAGFSEHISKPYNPADLVARIVSLLSEYSKSK